MLINKIEFTKLEKEGSKADKPFFDYLALEIGKVYVVTITIDGCPACAKQKPKLKKLAMEIVQKHGNKIVFNEVHVKYNEGFKEESARSKDVFGYYFYPTNMILLRTKDRGVFEFYRNVSPPMKELEKNIERAIETARILKEAT